MKNLILTAVFACGLLSSCNNQIKTENTMEQTLTLTQEWDKTFAKSEKVSHKKVIEAFFNENLITESK